ncbi:PREDICTED: RING-H2 finger protein ATL58-like [Camelina sativa]|uniref:RING-type E3 ubiquitin transferase n=1 Tax=Camelina sativa TaxID=90675 RepID=A0ABM0X0D9_CAMSA|nr:PREDICTED: RING-H2 finger protein ATL58-like [Camelina sativa]
MSYSNSNPENYSSSSAGTNSPELKLYQAFIFSVPICFTFIILFLFYLIYLRRGSSDLSSLGMRTTFIPGTALSTAELGLSKELREMLPIVVFKESFTVMDSQCSVCLGEYQADDKLQQIPVCKHTFHMDCIDLWLTSHTTCPLCRLALLPSQPRQTEEDSGPSLVSPDEEVLSQPASQPVNQRVVSSQPESEPVNHRQVWSQPESEPVNHLNDGQEQQSDPTQCDRDAEEGLKEMQEDEQNSIGTSNACCSCRPG